MFLCETLSKRSADVAYYVMHLFDNGNTRVWSTAIFSGTVTILKNPISWHDFQFILCS